MSHCKKVSGCVESPCWNFGFLGLFVRATCSIFDSTVLTWSWSFAPAKKFSLPPHHIFDQVSEAITARAKTHRAIRDEHFLNTDNLSTQHAHLRSARHEILTTRQRVIYQKMRIAWGSKDNFCWLGTDVVMKSQFMFPCFTVVFTVAKSKKCSSQLQPSSVQVAQNQHNYSSENQWGSKENFCLQHKGLFWRS